MDFPVRVTVLPYSVREGRLNDLSVSGAFIRTNLEPRLLSRVQIAMALPFYPKHEAPLIFAYVARKYPDGIGVEWCEFAPLPVREILRAISVRPHSRLRGPARAGFIDDGAAGGAVVEARHLTAPSAGSGSFLLRLAGILLQKLARNGHI